jgi:N-acyl-D-aspartate/D-glutamate deacylase
VGKKKECDNQRATWEEREWIRNTGESLDAFRERIHNDLPVGELPNLLSVTEAIRKITSMPAQRKHLIGRGQVQVGYFADITVFDPNTVIDRAAYTKSTKLSEGIDTVLVNGQVEFEHGALTGVTAGRAPRGPGWVN